MRLVGVSAVLLLVCFLFQSVDASSETSLDVFNGPNFDSDSNVVFFICSLDGKVHAIDAASGELLWSYGTGGYLINTERTHFMNNGRNVTFIPGINGDLYAFAEGSGVTKFPVSVWTLVDKSPFLSSEGILFLGSKVHHRAVLNPQTGQKASAFPFKTSPSDSTCSSDSENGHHDENQAKNQQHFIELVRSDYQVYASAQIDGAKAKDVALEATYSDVDMLKFTLGRYRIYSRYSRPLTKNDMPYVPHLTASVEGLLNATHRVTGEHLWSTQLKSKLVSLPVHVLITPSDNGTPAFGSISLLFDVPDKARYDGREHLYIGEAVGHTYATKLLPTSDQHSSRLLPFPQTTGSEIVSTVDSTVSPSAGHLPLPIQTYEQHLARRTSEASSPTPTQSMALTVANAVDCTFDSPGFPACLHGFYSGYPNQVHKQETDIEVVDLDVTNESLDDQVKPDKAIADKEPVSKRLVFGMLGAGILIGILLTVFLVCYCIRRNPSNGMYQQFLSPAATPISGTPGFSAIANPEVDNFEMLPGSAVPSVSPISSTDAADSASNSIGKAESKEQDSEPAQVQSEAFDAVLQMLTRSRYLSDFEQLDADDHGGALLGRGGFGTVVRARNRLDKVVYAVKKVRLNRCGTTEIEQVLREVSSLALLDHPHIVRYYNSWVEENGEHDQRLEESFEGDSVSDLQSPLTLTLRGEDETYNSSKLRTYGESSQDKSSLFNEFDNPLLSPDANFGFPLNTEDLGFSFGGGEDSCNNSNAGVVSDVSQSAADSVADASDDRQGVGLTLSKSAKGDVTPGSHTSVAGHAGGKALRTGRHYTLYIQMQLCAHGSLETWLNRPSREIDRQANLTIFRQIISGLVHIHSHDLIHRDLKPANIFLTADGDGARIGDFGLSKQTTSAKGVVTVEMDSPKHFNSSPALNLLGQGKSHTRGIGSPLYCSPEQLSGKQYSKKSDIFSLGVIFCEMHCIFSTGHERLKILNNCRAGIFGETSLREEGLACDFARLLLSPNPANRPSAEDIKTHPYITGEKPVSN
mmetsp:Transcript_30844/g.60194  ORF Transcript_30844/g.60194 Transcript_30844/m.60194 type:complete len:1033 (+) Transcript_30844:62-3160(+)